MSLLSKWKDEGTLASGTFDTLQKFIDLLLQWNSRINLTGLGSREAIEEILVGESVLAAAAFPLSRKRTLDFGSGAGIPGLVWAILDPSIRLTSVEIRAKKISFQKEVVRQLGLSAEVIQGKFPDVVRHRKFNVIATRAVRFDEKLLERCTSLLEPNGSLLRFASSRTDPGIWQAVPLSDKSSLLILSI
jgi:16S rRNA (guanine527-N7)-methyltransferase